MRPSTVSCIEGVALTSKLAAMVEHDDVKGPAQCKVTTHLFGPSGHTQLVDQSGVAIKLVVRIAGVDSDPSSVNRRLSACVGST